MTAITLQNVEIVEFLSQFEAGQQDKQQRTALMLAAISGFSESIQYLKQEIGMVDENGMTALMHACKNRNLDCALQLFDEAEKVDFDQNTALMYAAQQGLHAIVQLIQFREFYLGDYYGKSALDYARESGNEQCKQILSETEIEIEQWMQASADGDADYIVQHVDKLKKAKDQNGQTALIKASKSGQCGIINILKKYELNVQDENERTALMYSCFYNHQDCALLLLDEAGKQDLWKRSALMMAVERNQIEIVNQLVQKEAGLMDQDGMSALMIACKSNNFECAKLLVCESGVVSKYRKSAMMYAAESGCCEIIPFLIKKEKRLQEVEKLTALMYACRNKNLNCVKLLLEEAGIVINESKYTQNTALTFAIQYGFVEAFEILAPYELHIGMIHDSTVLYYCRYYTNHMQIFNKVQEELDTNWFALVNNAVDLVMMKQLKYVRAINEDGQTLLMLAAQKGNEKLVEFLSQYEIGMRDPRGRTALMFACKNSQLECAKLLVVEVGKVDDNNQNALMYAAESGCVEIIKLLIQKEIRQRDKYGSTALIKAICSKCNKTTKLQCIELLISERDMNDNNSSYISSTPLIIASKYGCDEAIPLFFEHDKGKYQFNFSKSGSALECAAESGYEKCVKLLLPELDILEKVDELLQQLQKDCVIQNQNCLQLVTDYVSSQKATLSGIKTKIQQFQSDKLQIQQQIQECSISQVEELKEFEQLNCFINLNVRSSESL